jgi:hypothetical protein
MWSRLAKPQRLKLLETIRLPNQTSLCILECDGRQFLISTSVHGATLLEPIGQSSTEQPALRK